MIKLENYKDPEGEILETYSVGDLLRIVQDWKENLELNHKNIYEVPVYIKDGFEKYVIHQASLSFGKSFSTSFEFSKTYGKCNFVAPDKRPEGGGEYWQTRGESSFDVSGFVVSKLAEKDFFEWSSIFLKRTIRRHGSIIVNLNRLGFSSSSVPRSLMSVNSVRCQRTTEEY